MYCITTIIAVYTHSTFVHIVCTYIILCTFVHVRMIRAYVQSCKGKHYRCTMVKAIGFFLQIVGNWKHKTDAWPYGRREPGDVKCFPHAAMQPISNP